MHILITLCIYEIYISIFRSVSFLEADAVDKDEEREGGGGRGGGGGGECRFSTEDRFSAPALAALLVTRPGSVYAESNCAEDDGKLCDFREVRGRILKTVDSVVEGVGSRQECSNLCTNAKYRYAGEDFLIPHMMLGRVGKSFTIGERRSATIGAWKCNFPPF